MVPDLTWASAPAALDGFAKASLSMRTAFAASDVADVTLSLGKGARSAGLTADGEVGFGDGDRPLRLNGLEPRVTIHAAAVGVRSGDAILIPEGARSVLRSAGDGMRVPVVDVLDELAGVPIDVLKMDIEGSEHPLLADDRFGTLRVGVLVMEWHNTAAVPQARLACKARLEAAGYEVQDGADPHDGAGVFWARRAAGTGSPGLR